MNKWRFSSSGEEAEFFERIPVDLFINILSRLPVKSKAQCRLVSKFWSSIIRRPNYNQLFPVKSAAPPRLFFAIEDAGDLFFYSSPQPHNPVENTSLVATLHHGTCINLCRPVCGLVCLNTQNILLGLIYNPITGEHLTLPELRSEKIESKSVCDKARYSLGYDPIDKQLKVLCIITWSCNGSKNLSDEYRVLTLGTGYKNLLWRKIQSCTTRYSVREQGICIDGVLYYPPEMYTRKRTIVCFDVRSEKFGFTNIDQEMAAKISGRDSNFSLIDYKGKLGACNLDKASVELWVLEDAKKSKWSKHIYRIFNPWLAYMGRVRLAGMINSCEFVFYPSLTEYPYSIMYYNLESNTFTELAFSDIITNTESHVVVRRHGLYTGFWLEPRLQLRLVHELLYPVPNVSLL